MKKTLLLSFLTTFFFQAYAFDTLTVRQAYSFDIGDTFDFNVQLHITANGNGFDAGAQERWIVLDKRISSGNDSIIYTISERYTPTRFEDIVPLIITNLDSSIIVDFDSMFHTSTDTTISIDSVARTDGRISNSLYSHFFHNLINYTEGLGTSYSSIWGAHDLPTPGAWYVVNNISEMIFYSKAGQRYGTPIDFIPHPRQTHYIPIPETCAMWTYADYDNQKNIQIQTGAHIIYNNQNYVSLIQRTYNYSNQALSSDSIVGYFYNDTIGHKVYYTDSLGRTYLWRIYDFDLVDSNNIIGIPYFLLRVDTQNNYHRATWYISTMTPFGDYYSSSYLEGVGSLQGLFYKPDGCQTDMSGHQRCGPTLLSFCVCGTPVYLDYPGLSDACYPLTVQGANPDTHLVIYPDPIQNKLSLNISLLAHPDVSMILSDMQGRTMYQASVTEKISQHDLSMLSSGIYSLHLYSNGQLINTSKIVKQ